MRIINMKCLFSLLAFLSRLENAVVVNALQVSHKDRWIALTDLFGDFLALEGVTGWLVSPSLDVALSASTVDVGGARPFVGSGEVVGEGVSFTVVVVGSDIVGVVDVADVAVDVAVVELDELETDTGFSVVVVVIAFFRWPYFASVKQMSNTRDFDKNSLST